jgi:hypothetical protein
MPQLDDKTYRFYPLCHDGLLTFIYFSSFLPLRSTLVPWSIALNLVTAVAAFRPLLYQEGLVTALPTVLEEKIPVSSRAVKQEILSFFPIDPVRFQRVSQFPLGLRKDNKNG